MEESVFRSVTELLGIEMDPVLLGQVNSAFERLTRIGVGPAGGFVLSDESTKWSTFFPAGPRLTDVKTYVLFSVALQRDPPAIHAVHSAINERVQDAYKRLKMRR